MGLGYDSSGNALIMYGGREDVNGEDIVLSDLWIYDITAGKTQLNPVMSKSQHKGVGDAVRNIEKKINTECTGFLQVEL